MKGKLIDSYTVIADNVPADVKIWDVEEDNVPIYEIIIPKVAKATELILEDLKDQLARKVPVDVEEITDPEKTKDLKQKFFSDAKVIIKNALPAQEERKINILSGIMLHKMLGLGFVDVLMADNWLEELAINGVKQPISVYHKKHGWCKTTMKVETEEEIYNLSSQIGRKVGREISSLNPIMDAHLLTGDRVASTLFPISTAGNTITIRRFARNPWTIVHFISPEYKTLSPEVAALLWQAIHYELNILIAGGTAAGKTSVLSAVSGLIPPNQRIISIEDTREISLPAQLEWNWVPLTTRNPNPEGQGEVTMLDLMVRSLRMRPDRIIVGEVRRKAQAETMFEAMHTGHSVYTTMHADTVEQVKRRLIEPPIQIPVTEVESLQLILVQYRDRRKGLRRSLELAEVLTGGKSGIETNYLYRWLPRTDKFEKVSESIRVFEDLNLHTGMTLKEIKADLKEKENILNWMLKNNIQDIAQVGRVIKTYYRNRDLLLDLVKKNKKPAFVIKKQEPVEEKPLTRKKPQKTSTRKKPQKTPTRKKSQRSKKWLG
jgi:flagellar protein FlaI